MKSKFKGFIVTQSEDNQFLGNVVEQDFSTLPEGDILIRVHYSSLNYKDALSARGNRGVTRKFPHIPGIDAAGIVVKSNSDRILKDMPVLVTGFDLGMDTWGGFCEYICIPVDWVIPLPNGLTLKEAMILGTAGFTAALSVNALQAKIPPEAGEILVTGATGGVGSLSIAILAKLGYSVVAASGKGDRHKFLKTCGANAMIERKELEDITDKALLKARWAGAIDTVGGNILGTIAKSLQYGGIVTTCGLVAGDRITTTIYPFILRGVSLIGIDSVQCPLSLRLLIWEKLASEWKPEGLAEMATAIGLSQLPEYITKILQGQITGRILVDVVNLQL
ncbi:YhdH/YhfP family quinone oxidoreductase [Spirulina sp. 06S082]|uniref:YhdH/YhfP family quinone oxidoreductase n=1 Tax=Spirulina sp. 06S082 TaxID=3110248 RepID=UPI002B21B9F3|nr:YhdH/YhfP family quinone oxidoreductase [Spirulina sp. 06S082]MEA5467804.1 YhdH/YhfP family quinone oxidoreductase [Spirulina sp. 06S082]